MLSRQRFATDYGVIIMSTLLFSILGLSLAAQQCSIWREIAPCTCRKDTSRINVNCEKMTSYQEVVNSLQNRFAPTDRIVLQISSSVLEDLPDRSFKELNMTIESIQLNHDNLSALSPITFSGLANVNSLSLSDNNLGLVPEHILEIFPNVKTLDLGRVGIRNLTEHNFKNIPYVQNLILCGNLISQMERTCLPPTLRQLHLGRNKIKDLNGTLTNLTDVEWILINANELTTLENQLPTIAPRLIMIHAAYNEIEKLPQHLKTFTALQSLFIHNNMLSSLDGTLSKLRKLERASFEHNRISILTKEDFLETESLQCLCMGNNQVTSLNNSISTLRSLAVLNLTHNLLSEFSLEEIKGLQKLRTVDLSFNQISKLHGPTANLVEWETKLSELILNNNELVELNGALSGLPSLTKLNLSFNKLAQLSPDDLIGLDQLQVLDISHNKLVTLEETGKSFLPSLTDLIASHNYLTVLDHDFHGLPVLCWADLSNNQIISLGRDLVSKTRCKVQDTLKILLEDNPILCDAALPEIFAAMEINHTRIKGVPHCEQTTEVISTITESVTPFTQDLNNIVYKPLPYSMNHANKPSDSSKDEPLMAITIDDNDRLIKQENVEERVVKYDPITEVKLKTQEINEQNNLPVFDSQPTKVIIEEPPVQNLDSFLQREQFNILTSEIEQLKLKVQELTVQNKILSQSINQSSLESNQTNTDINNNNKKITEKLKDLGVS